MAADEWRDVLRVAHLTGGLQAANPPGSRIEVGPSLGGSFAFDLPSYGALPTVLEDLGLRVMGIEYYSRREHLEGLSPAHWRPFYHTPDARWPSWDAEYSWMRLTYGAYRDGNALFADITNRICFEYKAASFRLLDVARAYHRELIAKWKGKQFEGGGRRFKTINSMFVYLAIHAFLTELATLRDYLAEFLGRFVLEPYVPSSVRVRKLTTLTKRVLPAAAHDHPWAAKLLASTERMSADPWLADFGAYRDFVVHSAPVAQLGSGWLREVLVPVRGRADGLPAVQFLLPENPHVVLEARSNDPSTTIADDIETGNDAYDYCHAALRRFAELGLEVASRSPIKPAEAQIRPGTGDQMSIDWV